TAKERGLPSGEEIERGITLHHGSDANQRAVLGGQRPLPRAFEDDLRPAGNQWRSRQRFHHALVLFFLLVGGIEEQNVGRLAGLGQLREAAANLSGDHLDALGDSEALEVFADQRNGGAVFFQKHYEAGAAAGRFDADSAGAGVAVYEEAARNARLQDVEEGFSQAVAGGTQRHAVGARDAAAAVFAGDHSHNFFIPPLRAGSGASTAGRGRP